MHAHIHRKTYEPNKPKKPYTLLKAIFLLGVYQEISAKKKKKTKKTYSMLELI